MTTTTLFLLLANPSILIIELRIWSIQSKVLVRLLCSLLRTHWLSDRSELETFGRSPQCPGCSNSSRSMSAEWREENVFCSDALERNCEAASMATSGKYGVRVYIRKRRTTFSCTVNIVLRTEWTLVFFSRVQRTLRNPSTWNETIFFLESIMFSKGPLFFCFNCESITSEEQSLSIFSSFLSFSRSRWKSNKNFKTEKERIKCCYSPISFFLSFCLSFSSSVGHYPSGMHALV